MLGHIKSPGRPLSSATPKWTIETLGTGAVMGSRLFGIVVCGALAMASRLQAQTQEDLRRECNRAAFERYSIANIAIMTSQPPMTPEAQRQQRRLQQVYCARLARCAVIGTDPSSAAVAYSAALSSCLKEEATEVQGYDDD